MRKKLYSALVGAICLSLGACSPQTSEEIPTGTPTVAPWDQSADIEFQTVHDFDWKASFESNLEKALAEPVSCHIDPDTQEHTAYQSSIEDIPDDFHNNTWDHYLTVTKTRWGLSGNCYRFLPGVTDLSGVVDDIQAFNALVDYIYDEVMEAYTGSSNYHEWENWYFDKGAPRIVDIEFEHNTPENTDPNYYCWMAQDVDSKIRRRAEEEFRKK